MTRLESHIWFVLFTPFVLSLFPTFLPFFFDQLSIFLWFTFISFFSLLIPCYFSGCFMIYSLYPWLITVFFWETLCYFTYINKNLTTVYLHFSSPSLYVIIFTHFTFMYVLNSTIHCYLFCWGNYFQKICFPGTLALSFFPCSYHIGALHFFCADSDFHLVGRIFLLPSTVLVVRGFWWIISVSVYLQVSLFAFPFQRHISQV